MHSPIIDGVRSQGMFAVDSCFMWVLDPNGFNGRVFNGTDSD